MSKRVILIVVAVVVAGGGTVARFVFRKPGLPPGFAGANGRLEAKQVDTATKYQGRSLFQRVLLGLSDVDWNRGH
jgi:HlyD family secretion protein